MHLAASSGKVEAVLQLLGALASVSVKDDSGENALHKAARHGHKSVC